MVLVEANSLRLGLFDSVSNYSSQSVDYNVSSLAIAFNWIVAVQHFNERRGDLLAVLGEASLLSCKKNLSIAAYCDDGGYTARTMYNMLDYRSEIDVVVGMPLDTVALSAIIDAQSMGIPVISHAAPSSLLSNQYQYPMFLRTGPSDDMAALNIANLTAQLGLGAVALVYLSTEQAFSDSFVTALQSLNIACSSFAYLQDDLPSMTLALQGIAGLELNVVVFHGFADDIIDLLPSAAKTYGFLNPDKMFIFTAFDRPLTSDEIAANEMLAQVMRGALRISPEIPTSQNQTFGKYLRLWESFNQYSSLANSYFPPSGYQNDSWGCRNSNLTGMTVSDNFLSDSLENPLPSWAWAYDSIIALVSREKSLLVQTPFQVRLICVSCAGRGNVFRFNIQHSYRKRFVWSLDAG